MKRMTSEELSATYGPVLGEAFRVACMLAMDAGKGRWLDAGTFEADITCEESVAFLERAGAAYRRGDLDEVERLCKEAAV